MAAGLACPVSPALASICSGGRGWAERGSWVQNALDDFAGAVPPEDGVNWEAYSHDELYQMLWQDADVADVSTVAREWAEHRTALTTHAEVLREQSAALRDSWQGAGAEEAAGRLEALAGRVEKISEFALAGEQATQEAADALAMARAMMPPPPGKSPAPLAGVPEFGAAPAAPTGSTAPMSAAFGAVASGGASFYVGGDMTDQQKAQAVRAMQTYESSLADGSQRLGQARGSIPAAATTQVAGAQAAPAPGNVGVGWQRLVGSGYGGGLGGGGLGGGQGAPTGPGVRFGVLPGVAGSGVPAGQLAEAAARAAGHGGMAPPVGGQRGVGAEEQRHENQLPTIDHGLFKVDTPTAVAVIDQATGALR